MQYLELKDIFTHNLKGFSLKIPLNKLVVITGPSGSGKSSLAVDTIAEEAKNRFLQVLNYSKDFFITKTYKAKFLTPLPPVISLTQGLKDWFPYKTVADFFLITNFLETLFLEEGEYYCPECNTYTRINSLNEAIKWFQALKKGTRFYFLLPLEKPSSKALEYLLSQGFSKYFIDNREIDLSEEKPPKQFERVFLVLDRMIKEEKEVDRFLEDLRMSLSINRGRVVLRLPSGEEVAFNLRPVCKGCGAGLLIFWKKCQVCRGYGYKEKIPCESCKGLKLDPLVLETRIFGRSVRKWLNLSLKEFYEFLKKTGFQKERRIWVDSLKVVLEKAIYMELDYLNVSTPVFKLSTGERKLLELILMFSSELQNCLYILDEPSLALDFSKKNKLIELLQDIVKKQNSVILIEHDPYLIKEGDFIIELGPKGGEKGGHLIKACFKEEYFKNTDSLTLEYLKGRKKLFRPKRAENEFIYLRNIMLLKKGINLIYGSVGSKKSLIFNELAKELMKAGKEVALSETEVFRKRGDWIITYLGIWDELRKIFVKTPYARIKGLTSKHFSFTSKEGVCAGCKGRGKKVYESNGVKLEVLCEECFGKRLNKEALELEYKGFKVSELLDFTVEEAISVFANISKIKEKLLHIKDLGLGYLKLSQELGSISGGERIRLSLVKRLFSKKGLDFVFLEYPFQGLHLEDVKNFLKWMEFLLEKDVTFVILETNPIILLLSDFVIEVKGGEVVFAGFKEEWLKGFKGTSEFKVLEFYKNLVEGV